ncbi:DUF6348 family protein [Actinoplanes sp. NBC_00393]|uniref:DUF6348 family protein n=1 Tax=Actinoplanes sp. NBC_00393 TaxID=2975953 RepID=UPI002E2382CA
MSDEAVVVGVAAFREGVEPPGDDEVRARLRAAGVEPWLAERLLVFLPLAYGRRVLTGVQFAGTFLDGGVERPLDAEPVFVAAIAQAEIAGRADIERIGLRSAEFAAVNNALHAGSNLTDLALGPVALAVPLPAPAPGDGGVPSPAAIFAGLLAAHGLRVENLCVGDAEFSVRLFSHPSPMPGMVMAQVDVGIDHPALAEPWMVESCAGAGSTWREAIRQAMTMFQRGVVHPVVEALLARGAAAGQVSWERYEHPSGPFDLCLGAQITLFTPDPVPSAGPLLDRLLQELRDVPLSDGVHALRIFTCHRDGSLITNELLLDGEPWEAGARVIAAAPPPAPAGMIGQRLFGLLVPAT